MRKSTLMSIAILFLVTFIIPPLISGCGTDFESLALEILEEWSNEHDINPSTAGGAWNLTKRTASGSTGDEEADAALGVIKTISDIHEGDKLLEEGEKLQSEGKPKEAAEKMDAAIEKRPDDLSYRISRGSLAMQEGDYDTSITQHGEAMRRLGTELVVPGMDNHLSEVKHPRPHDEVRYFSMVIDKLESSNIRPSEMNSELRNWYYTQLSAAYAGRAEAIYQIAGKSTDEYQTDWAKAEELYRTRIN